uniref:uncharacterized protein LOC122603206 n=1 Tax=Erigeron canadensis TaxID=72917 RepID=UPI001CB90B6F|nr:uncharacterized protein LOC122603206 [Erigeron canadensis]
MCLQRANQGVEPDLVEMYGNRHKHADGSWEHPTAQANYEKLKKKKDDAEQDPIPTPQPDLFPATFGNRSGHRRGLGRIVRGVGDTEYDYTHLTQPQGTSQIPDLNSTPPQEPWFDPDTIFNWSGPAQAHGSQYGSTSSYGSHFAVPFPFSVASINLGSDYIDLGNDDDDDNDN